MNNKIFYYERQGKKWQCVSTESFTDPHEARRTFISAVVASGHPASDQKIIWTNGKLQIAGKFLITAHK